MWYLDTVVALLNRPALILETASVSRYSRRFVVDTKLHPDVTAVAREMGELSRDLRKKLHVDITKDISNSIHEQLAAHVGPLGKRIGDIKDMNIGLSRAVRDLKRPREIQPSVHSLLVKAIACHLIGAAYERPTAVVAAERYENNRRLLDALADPGQIITRAAVSPASMYQPGWAMELVAAGNNGAIASLAPASVYAQLAMRGQRVSFIGVGSVRIPTPTPASDVGGVFIAEGAPIPVKRMTLAGVKLTPCKAAVISLFSEELLAHSGSGDQAGHGRRYRQLGGCCPARRSGCRYNQTRWPACRFYTAAAFSWYRP